MTELNIFKIEYYWYEDEHEETLLIKKVEQEEFEKDLMDAKKFAEKFKGVEIKKGNYLGRGYSVECLPEFYEQIIWFLTKKKGYKECFINDRISYIIDDNCDKKINIVKSEKIIKKTDLRLRTKKR